MSLKHEKMVRESSVCINTSMDYKRIYDDLITFRQTHATSGYVEQHHIVMRSMGGSDDDSNLVPLTGREHWIAHLLLHKIHKNSQTAHACHMMAMRCEERGIAYIKNSRMYEKIRKECAKVLGMHNSILQKGEKNSQYGTRWICNTTLKENMKISRDQNIPDGWTLGRIMPNFVKSPRSEETKKRISESSKGLKKSELHKKSLRGPRPHTKGLIWIHHPMLKIARKISSTDDIPNGYIPGMLKRK